MNAPTIFIKQDKESYYWILCLSENIKKPTCRSPVNYKQLIKARRSAMRFCKHLTGKIKIIGSDEVVIVDEVGDGRKKTRA